MYYVHNTLLYTTYFRFQIPLTSLRPVSLLPNSQTIPDTLSFITNFCFMFFLYRISFLSNDSILILLYYIVFMLYSIYIYISIIYKNYIIYVQYIINCIILYIWAFLFSRHSYVTIIVLRNEQSNHPRDERGKEDRYGPFFRSGYLFFFARTKVLSAHDFLNFSCLSNHVTRFPVILFATSFTLLVFMKRHPCDAKRETMMALLFWLARFYIFGFFAATISPTTYSSFPKPPKNFPSSVPTTFFPGARSHGFFRSW